MRNATSNLVSAVLLSGATGLLVLGHPAEVRAQSAFFCPGKIPNLQNVACTDGKNAAFSGAALASQALSELSETTTQETTKNAIDAVTTRRAQDRAALRGGVFAGGRNLPAHPQARVRSSGVTGARA